MNGRNSAQSVRTLSGVLCFAAAVDVGVSWLLGKPGFGSHTRIIFALLPIPANLVLVAVIVRRILKLDEFLRRVHLEAIAIAFLLTVLAASTYEDLQKAHVVGSLNVGIVWIFMAAFYGIGYFVAARHYR